MRQAVGAAASRGAEPCRGRRRSAGAQAGGALPRLAQNYAGQLKRSGVFLRVAQAGDVWADELPQPDSALPEVPPEGQRVHTVLLSGGRHVYLRRAARPAGGCSRHMRV